MLLTVAKATDDRVTVDEGRVLAWEAALDHDLIFDDARRFILKHYADNTIPVMPAHVNGLWRSEKRTLKDRADSKAWFAEQRALAAQAPDPTPYIEEIRKTLKTPKENVAS